MELITDKETLERIDSAPETLESNKENILRIIKEFEFCSWSEKKILEAIETPVNTKFFQYDLSPTSQRLFFKLTADDKKQLREEVRLINDHYHNNYYNNLDEEDRAKQPKITVIDAKSDKMSSIMGSSRYLVVSRNPVDILLCSTNQNYGSCYSMDSTYGYAFGVPAIIPNKDIYVCYLTKGKHGNYSIENSSDKYEFRYMRMLSRFFAYHCYDYKEGLSSSGEKQDMLGLGYIYPKDNQYNMNHNDIRFNVIAKWFQQQNIEVIMPDIQSLDWRNNSNRFNMRDMSDGYRLKIVEEKETFFIAENNQDNEMNPYYDNINDLNSREPNFKLFDGECGSHKDLPEDISISPVDKIENRRSWEDIYDECDGDYENCYDCGERVRGDDRYYISRPNRFVCENCYNDDYFRCPKCDDMFHNDYHREIYTCDSDSTWHHLDICERCFEQGSYCVCEKCGDEFHTDDIQYVGDSAYCLCCYEKEVTSCDVCGDSIHNTNARENFKGCTVCKDCYKGKLINYNITNSTQFLEFNIPKKMYFEILLAMKNNNQSLNFNKGGELFNKYTEYQKAASHEWNDLCSRNTAVATKQITPVFEQDWWRAEDVTKVFKRTKVNGQWFKTIITINWER